MLYLKFLPFELIQELFCYFNHQTTCSLLEFLNFSPEKSIKIWQYKILNELKYDKSYFEHTIMPFDRKYLELKSNQSVDYGSEAFLDRFEVMEHLGRLPDNNETNTLLYYFIEKYKDCDHGFIESLLMGALTSNNQTILNKYKKYLYCSINSISDVHDHSDLIVLAIAFDHKDFIEHFRKMFLSNPEISNELCQLKMVACCVIGDINNLIALNENDALDDNYYDLSSFFAFEYKYKQIIDFLISKSC